MDATNIKCHSFDTGRNNNNVMTKTHKMDIYATTPGNYLTSRFTSGGDYNPISKLNLKMISKGTPNNTNEIHPTR